jgi:hypothetical protein
MNTIDRFVVQNDAFGLSYHKRQLYAEGGTPEPEIVLEALGYRRGNVVNSLSDIDFYEADDDWVRGEFRAVSEIPATSPHLRGIARDMGLPEEVR